MQSTGIPSKFPIVWGNSAGGGYIRSIPTLSQIGVQAGAASLADGYPPVCFLPEGAGGTPPFGQDMNGILKQITQWLQWAQAGGAVPYDSTFQTSIGGYPAGAIVESTVTVGLFWLSTIENNVSNPDTGGGGWINPYPSTGETSWRPTSEVVPGKVRLNSLTIGNAASNGSERANADTAAAFAWVWNNFSNTQCPLLNSSGSPISRGASAAADYAINSAVTLPDMRGRTNLGLDTMGTASAGRLTGGTFSSGSSSVAGSVGGEAAHTLLIGEMPAHSHTFNGSAATWNANQSNVVIQAGGGLGLTGGSGSGGFTTLTVTVTPAGTNANNGGSGVHNTLPPFMLGTWYVKL